MADIRISELQELINVQDSDVLVINDITAATTKKITRDRFLVGITRNVFDSDNNAVAKQDLKVNNDLIVGGDIEATGDVSFGSLTDVTAGITALRFIGTGIENNDSNGAIPTAAAVADYLDYFLADLYDSATLPVNLDALTNVSIVTPLANEVLKYDGSNWINAVDSSGITNLGALDDVIISSLTDDQVLKYNGSYWVNATDSAGPTNLYQLEDIFIDSALSSNPLTTGQVLKWNGTKWANANDSAGGGGGAGGGLDSALTLQLISSSVNLNTLSGVAVTAPSTNQVLKYNGSQWVNAADSVGAGGSNALNDLTDVVISTPSTNQVLKYNGANWVNATDSAGPTNLYQLDDIFIDSALSANPLTSGQIVKWNGSKWANTSLPKQYPAITELSVQNNGSSAYRFTNQYGDSDNPTIYAISGTTIAFNLTNVSNQHPFLIQEDSGGGFANYSTGLIHVDDNGVEVTADSAQGKTSGVLYWQIPASTHSTTNAYRYVCSVHSGMNGVINIKNISAI